MLAHWPAASEPTSALSQTPSKGKEGKVTRMAPQSHGPRGLAGKPTVLGSAQGPGPPQAPRYRQRSGPELQELKGSPHASCQLPCVSTRGHHMGRHHRTTEIAAFISWSKAGRGHPHGSFFQKSRSGAAQTLNTLAFIWIRYQDMQQSGHITVTHR